MTPQPPFPSAPAVRSRLWSPVAVAAGCLIAYLALGTERIVPAPAVLSHGIPVFAYYAWAFQHASYSDIVALYATRNLYVHPLLYWRQMFEYPPVMGLLVWLTSWAPGLNGYIAANVLGLGLAAWGTIWAAAQVQGWPRAVIWAACPLLAVYAIYNWDLYGLLAYGLAVVTARRGYWGWGGIWTGLGAATKLFPAVLLPFLVADRLRARDRRGAVAVMAGALGAWGVTNAPVALGARTGWLVFWQYNASRPADPGFYQWLGWATTTVNLVSLLAVLSGGLILAACVWRSRLGWAEAAAVALCWWFLMNKVYSPQYSLWAVYALLLAGGAWGSMITVSLAGAADFGLAMVWLYGGTTNQPWLGWFQVTVPVLVITGRYLCYVAVIGARLGFRAPQSSAPALSALVPGS